MTNPSTRVLVVDDEEDNRLALALLLEELGWSADEAGSLGQARQKLGGSSFDLVVLDLRLQDGSGADLIPEIRVQHPTAKVVVISGLDEPEVTRAADLVLLKASDPDRMLSALQRLVA